LLRRLLSALADAAVVTNAPSSIDPTAHVVANLMIIDILPEYLCAELVLTLPSNEIDDLCFTAL
jgi:hypothetical protein